MSVDPRGPIRTAIKVTPTASVTYVELSCGHVAELATHFHYKTGSDQRCFTCRKEAELLDTLK